MGDVYGMRRRSVLLGGFAALGVASSRGARAAEWPDRTIRMIMPFAAGGGTDVTARLLMQKLSEKLGVSVVVENRTGAQGNIGAQAVARSAPDGYTWLYNTSFVVTSPALMNNLTYDWRKDLMPVVGIASVPLVLLAHPSLPANTPEEFRDLVRARGNDLTYGSAGIGNTTHLATARLLQELNATGTHIPYAGDSQAVTDLMKGVIDYYSGTVNTALSFIASGSVKAIAIGTEKRIDSLPNLPTVAETIMPGYTAESWQGVMAPAGTPEPVVRRMSEEIQKIMADPEIVARLAQTSTIPMVRDTATYRTYLESEAAKWQTVIRNAGIEPQ